MTVGPLTSRPGRLGPLHHRYQRQPGPADRNYIIDVLDTGAAIDGVDVCRLSVIRCETGRPEQPGTCQYPTTTFPAALNDGHRRPERKRRQQSHRDFVA